MPARSGKLDDGAAVTMKPLANGPAIAAHWGRLPLRFEENRGQLDERVRFVARQSGVSLFFTAAGAVISLRETTPRAARHDAKVGHDLGAKARRPAPAKVLTLRVHGGDPRAKLEARQPLETRSNYFVGNDPRKWRSDVPNFGEVAYRDVKPGVDLVYHGSQDGRLEYDFIVAPGASSESLSVDVDGADRLRLAADGALEVEVGGRVVRQLPPVTYQIVNGQRHAIAGHYRITGPRQVAFALADYDHARPLVIDPVLVYASYLGGSDLDVVRYGSIALDGSGSAYVTGYTYSSDFPATTGAAQPSNHGSADAFVAKLNAAGSALSYVTYVGGTGFDETNAIAVDGGGNAYVIGDTASPDFPITLGAAQTANAGGNNEAFVFKLNATGSALSYATYLGGAGSDVGFGLAVDGGGNAYVTGLTTSTNFPITAGAVQTSNAGGFDDAFVVKLDVTGSTLSYATYFGGTGSDVGESLAVDRIGNAYVSGATTSTDFPTTAGALQSAKGGGNSDAFVVTLDAIGSTLSYATYLGGTGNEDGYGIAVDGRGNAYVTGPTTSPNFPVSASAAQTINAGGSDAFVAKLNSAGSALSYSTYLGGASNDYGWAIAVNTTGNAYITGTTQSNNFPITADANQATYGGNFDGFVARLNAAGTGLAYATYLGGTNEDNGQGIAVDTIGNVYVAGYTRSTNLSVTSGVVQASNKGTADAFIAKLYVSPPPLLIAPTSGTVAPRESRTFAASGGSGSGYVWSLAANASGGNIDASTGVYTAGPTSSVTDVIALTDSTSATTTVNVTVSEGVSITPAAPAAVPPMGTISFSASGGSNSGFLWVVSTNASGGRIDANGVYTAGATGNVTDTVQVTDSLGNRAMAILSVMAGVAIVPATPSLPPRDSISFSASGGSGMGYTWSLMTNASGGSIDSSSGAYTAGATGSVTDLVTLVDSLGNTAAVNVHVGAQVSISPRNAAVRTAAAVAFAVAGGSGSGYEWSLTTNGSGGHIDATSGAYVAGTRDDTDVVHVIDSLGNGADATVTVTATPPNDAGTGIGTSSTDAGGEVVAGDGCGCDVGGAGRLPWSLPTLVLLGLALFATPRRRC